MESKFEPSFKFLLHLSGACLRMCAAMVNIWRSGDNL